MQGIFNTKQEALDSISGGIENKLIFEVDKPIGIEVWQNDRYKDTEVYQVINLMNQVRNSVRFKLASLMYMKCLVLPSLDLVGFKDNTWYLIDKTNSAKEILFLKHDDHTYDYYYFNSNKDGWYISRCIDIVVNGFTVLAIESDEYLLSGINLITPDFKCYQVKINRINKFISENNLLEVDDGGAISFLGPAMKEIIPPFYTGSFSIGKTTGGNIYKMYGGKAFPDPVMIKINDLGTRAETMYDKPSGIESVDISIVRAEHIERKIPDRDFVIDDINYKHKIKYCGVLQNMKEYDSINLAYRTPENLFYGINYVDGFEKDNLVNEVCLIDVHGNEVVKPGRYSHIQYIHPKASIVVGHEGNKLDNKEIYGLWNGEYLAAPLGDILEWGVTKAFKVTYVKYKDGNYYFIGNDGKLYKTELEAFEYYVLDTGTEKFISARTYYKWITVDSNLNIVDIGDKPSGLVMRNKGQITHIVNNRVSS